MNVSVITVTYNSSDDLEKHWAGVGDLEIDWIVVDNASSDGSAEVAARLGARVIQLDRNLGFSAANNVGASHSTADFLIFANPDIELNIRGIERLRDMALEKRCLVAPQLINADGSLQENGRRHAFLYRKIQHFFGSRASQSGYEVRANEGEVVDVDWVIGAALCLPRSIFDAIGGWNERYFVYYEDSDLGMRLREAGVKSCIDGSVRWVHGWRRATRRTLSWSAWRLEIRSAFQFYRTYPLLLLHPRIPGVKRRIEVAESVS